MHSHCYKGKQSARVCLWFWRFKAGSRNLVCVVVQASPRSVIQTLLLKLKRAEEVYVRVCLYVSVCIGVYVSVVHVYAVYTNTQRFACLCVHKGQKRTLQSFTLCPNFLETEVSLVATKPQASSLSAPYCTGVTGTHVATPAEWQ